MSTPPFTHVVAVGLADGEVASFRRQAERAAPGIAVESVRGFDELGELALFNAGCALLLPLEGAPLSGAEEIRRLRARRSSVPVLLLVPLAAPLEAAIAADLGIVELLAREGYTAFDVRRALHCAAAARDRGERSAAAEERVRELEEDRVEYVRRIEDLSRRLALQSLDDELTGLRNERYMLRRVSEAVRQSRRHETPLSCLLLGLDKLAEVREKLGAEAGESMLKAAAEKLRHALRDTDLLSRYGHDEFLVLTPLTTSQGAVAAARRLRGIFVSQTAPHAGRDLPLGLAAGVASFRPEMAGAIELIQLAAEALAQARERGRGIEVL